ncbi:MAG: PilZ domain-containing protein [SAR324 cluster bacterium]|nr:PilZ domain-containing protein [SAR324 cluster bacterium]MCH8886508.1 PilZ domain-containing protein [SAR324 cluster bacterium]
MIEKDVNQLLQMHIDEANQDQQPPAKGSGAERRKATRLDANTTELTIRTDTKVHAIDISVAGLAFYSKFPVQIGQQLQITLSAMFTVDAEVVNCNLEEQDPNFMDLLYKVQCKFPEEEQGKYLLVAIKELEKRKKTSPSSGK